MQEIYIVFENSHPKIAFDREEDADKIIRIRREQTYKSGARYTPNYYMETIKLFEDGDNFDMVNLHI